VSSAKPAVSQRYAADYSRWDRLAEEEETAEQKAKKTELPGPAAQTFRKCILQRN
jgi:hypothetical protein